ncbi:hypothetical protein T261_5500 [Streptomyces lydicus]|nr:hypothetical protein T261_5500 [Streptomyces lydicus]
MSVQPHADQVLPLRRRVHLGVADRTRHPVHRVQQALGAVHLAARQTRSLVTVLVAAVVRRHHARLRTVQHGRLERPPGARARVPADEVDRQVVAVQLLPVGVRPVVDPAHLAEGEVVDPGLLVGHQTEQDDAHPLTLQTAVEGRRRYIRHGDEARPLRGGRFRFPAEIAQAGQAPALQDVDVGARAPGPVLPGDLPHRRGERRGPVDGQASAGALAGHRCRTAVEQQSAQQAEQHDEGAAQGEAELARSPALRIAPDPAPADEPADGHLTGTAAASGPASVPTVRSVPRAREQHQQFEVIALVQRHFGDEQPAAVVPQPTAVTGQHADQIRRVGVRHLDPDDGAFGELDGQRLLVVLPHYVLAAVVLEPQQRQRRVTDLLVLPQQPQLHQAVRVLGIHADRGVHLHAVADPLPARQKALHGPDGGGRHEPGRGQNRLGVRQSHGNLAQMIGWWDVCNVGRRQRFRGSFGSRSSTIHPPSSGAGPPPRAGPPTAGTETARRRHGTRISNLQIR